MFKFTEDDLEARGVYTRVGGMDGAGAGPLALRRVGPEG
jgi:hypothetical protein